MRLELNKRNVKKCKTEWLISKKGDKEMPEKAIINEIRKELGVNNVLDDEEQIYNDIQDIVMKDERLFDWNFKEKGKLINRIYLTIRKDLGILEPYCQDEDVTEIMVNGYKNIFIEKKGNIYKTDLKFISVEELEDLIRRIAANVHREINELNPIVDARLADGSRINAVYKNVALNGPILTIRKFPKSGLTMTDMIRFDTLTEEVAEFLGEMVRCGMNIIISGGTSSGKTSLLNVLSHYIPLEERVIVIEDSAELQLNSVENIVRLECRNSNVQEKGKVEMKDLIKSSLRMRPDRIVVGEVRGGEVMDMLQALNSGHDGSLSTAHANSVNGMLRRLEAMVLQSANFPMESIRSQIVEGIDIMVHLSRMPDRSRKIVEISELCDYKDGQYIKTELFKYDLVKGLYYTGNKIKRREKLEIRGYDGIC